MGYKYPLIYILPMSDITRICLILLMTSQGASIISFISLEFCLICLMTLGISSKIGVLKVGPISPPKLRVRVPNRGPKWGCPKLRSQIKVQNRGPKWGCPKSRSQIRVPNWGFKSGSQIGVPNRGVPNRGPKSGSQMGVSQIEVPNQGPK
jgi:hypothetical protein